MRVQEVHLPDGSCRYAVLNDDGTLLVPVVRYLKYLDSAGRSRNTLKGYAHALCLYFRYLEAADLDYYQVGLDDLAGFVRWLKAPAAPFVVPDEPARAATTINHALTVVSGFYDYLWRSGASDIDLSQQTFRTLSSVARSGSYKGFLHGIARGRPVQSHVLKQPTPRRRPQTLTPEEIQRLVDACRNRRDHLLLVLLYESSLRIGEALALWIEDIDIPRMKLHVRDRGALENGAEIKTPAAIRSVDVSRDLINLVMDYLAVCHTEEVQTNHLFIKLRGPRKGEAMTYHDVAHLFERLQKATGIDASAHLLRHSSLTALAKADWPPEHLRVRAGHAQFQTTYQMYVHPSEEEIRADWDRTESELRVRRSHERGTE